MEVQKVNYTPSFKALRIDKAWEGSKVLEEALKSSKALQKFGEKYDADLSYTSFFDEGSYKIIHPAVQISNIRPVNLYRKISDFFKGVIAPKGMFFSIRTNGTTDAQLLSKLNKLDSDSVLNKYYDTIRFM